MRTADGQNGGRRRTNGWKDEQTDDGRTDGQTDDGEIVLDSSRKGHALRSICCGHYRVGSIHKAKKDNSR